MSTYVKWFLWAALLIVQNLSFTVVSRARNSGSLEYHALAAVFSNGIWIISQIILLDSFMKVLRKDHKTRADKLKAAGIAVFYTVFTVAGSLLGHWCSQTWLEVGSRRVGA
jgi:hypothetical protein